MRKTLAGLLLVLLSLAAACTNHPRQPSGLGAFHVNFVGATDLGSEAKPIPFSATEARNFNIDIEALTYRDGSWVVDESFNGYAALTVQPTGKLEETPQLVQLTGGRARGVKLAIRLAYGTVRLVVSDTGYLPAASYAEAACNSNKIDEDGDGFADFPDDRGCFGLGDDSEEGGTASTGASPIITFDNPRIYDIQLPGKLPGKDQDRSALEGLRVSVNKGFMLVTRVSNDGLFVTDFDGVTWDVAANDWKANVHDLYYRSAFAYNYSKPRNILEGDCLVQLDGTVQEFYDYTELNMPTWKKGDFAFCASLARSRGLTACNPQDTEESKIIPCRQKLEGLANTPFDLTTVVVDLPGGKQASIWERMAEGFPSAERFESALVQLSNVEMFTDYEADGQPKPGFRRCDQNGNGVIDYSVKEEADCANECGDEPRCVVAETYDRYRQWTVHFLDGDIAGKRVMREVTIVSQSGIPKFDPIAAYNSYRGKTPKVLGKVVGTMRHLVFGRPPWTLELRRPSDCPDCVN